MVKVVTRRKKTDGKADDIGASYNRFKEFNGAKYTGMTIGRRHRWYYDEGEWKEKKVTPDRWEFEYAVKKRRAGRAPEGSGAPVGTAYHWYILADQTVQKLNANDYSTSMTGIKYKLAHKRAGKESWSSSERARKKRLIAILEEMIEQLREEIPPPVRKRATKARANVNGAAGRSRPSRTSRRMPSPSVRVGSRIP